MEKTFKRTIAKNSLKTIVFGLALALMLLAGSFQAEAAVPKFPQVTVTMINHEPDPVSPGNVVDVNFRIENEGTQAARNVEAKLVLKYPFSFYGEDEEIKELGTIAGYDVNPIGVRKQWRLLVDQGAATGEHQIEFWYRVDNGNWIKSGEYNITVRTREAVLAINQIRTSNDSIEPGSKTHVSFVLENQADNALRNIKLELDLLTQLTTSTSISFREMPFTPIGSGNQKYLKTLEAGESEEIFFEFFTDADAESKVYKVPYTLTYEDASGTNFTTEGILGLIVDARPDLSLNIESTEIYSAGSKGTLSIKLVNKGFADIKFLDIYLTGGDDYDVLSNPEVYIGKLDSDDYENAEFTLLVKEDAGDNLLLPLKLEYRDANGKLYTRDEPLELKLYSGAELRQRTNGGSTGTTLTVVIIIVLIIIGIILYRRSRARKKKAAAAK